MKDKHSHVPLALFLFFVTLGLWIGSWMVVCFGRVVGWLVLLAGIAIGAFLYVWREGVGIRAAAVGFLPGFWRAVVDASRSIVRGCVIVFRSSRIKPYGSVWGEFLQFLGVITSALCFGLAVKSFHDAAAMGYEWQKTLLLTRGFEFLFGGIHGAWILWASGLLFSSVVITKENLERVRHAETFGEQSALAASRPIPDGGEPPSLKALSSFCMTIGFVFFVLFLGGSLVVLVDGKLIFGTIGSIFSFVVFFFWKTWADIFGAQMVVATDARQRERKAVADVPDAFSASSSGNPERRVESASEIEATSSMDERAVVRWVSAFACVALAVAGLFSAFRFFGQIAADLRFEEWRAEREAAERKAREEREAAERRAVKVRNEAEREAAETKAKEQAAVKAAAENILASMVDIPGKDFKLGKTEVTQAQWESIMRENPSRFKGENNPVENVSWDDCQEFLKLLNSVPTIKASGLTFRLPRDSEWEYACRAGAAGKYCKLETGAEISESTLRQVAWFEDNSYKQTHPVGQKQPNAFGLYDMHGNVWEWCQDEYGQVESIAKGKDYEHDRVHRGGGWSNSAWLCGSSHRRGCSPGFRGLNLGFRLCASGRAD